MIKTPRIILIDIETSPIIGMVWEMWDAKVLKAIEPTKIISVAWKVLGEKITHCKAICDYKGYRANQVDDYELIHDTWKVLDEADIVIAHNGIAFDIKKLNVRFVHYGLLAPAYYTSVDTLKVAKKYFKFDSNSLDSLVKYLGIGEKMETGGFQLWVDCLAGDRDAWKRMKTYNVHDVILLEEVYLRLRPYMVNHPNLNVIANDIEKLHCATCMSSELTKRGWSNTQAGRKQRYQCGSCGSWSTGPYEKYKVRDHEQ